MTEGGEETAEPRSRSGQSGSGTIRSEPSPSLRHSRAYSHWRKRPRVDRVVCLPRRERVLHALRQERRGVLHVVQSHSHEPPIQKHARAEFPAELVLKAPLAAVDHPRPDDRHLGCALVAEVAHEPLLEPLRPGVIVAPLGVRLERSVLVEDRPARHLVEPVHREAARVDELPPPTGRSPIRSSRFFVAVTVVSNIERQVPAVVAARCTTASAERTASPSSASGRRRSARTTCTSRRSPTPPGTGLPGRTRALTAWPRPSRSSTTYRPRSCPLR